MITVWIIFHFQMAQRHTKKRAVESFPAIPTGMPVMEPAYCKIFSITDIIDLGVDTKLKEWHQQSMNIVEGSKGEGGEGGARTGGGGARAEGGEGEARTGGEGLKGEGGAGQAKGTSLALLALCCEPG